MSSSINSLHLGGRVCLRPEQPMFTPQELAEPPYLESSIAPQDAERVSQEVVIVQQPSTYPLAIGDIQRNREHFEIFQRALMEEFGEAASRVLNHPDYTFVFQQGLMPLTESVRVDIRARCEEAQSCKQRLDLLIRNFGIERVQPLIDDLYNDHYCGLRSFTDNEYNEMRMLMERQILRKGAWQTMGRTLTLRMDQFHCHDMLIGSNRKTYIDRLIISEFEFSKYCNQLQQRKGFEQRELALYRERCFLTQAIELRPEDLGILLERLPEQLFERKILQAAIDQAQTMSAAAREQSEEAREVSPITILAEMLEETKEIYPELLRQYEGLLNDIDARTEYFLEARRSARDLLNLTPIEEAPILLRSLCPQLEEDIQESADTAIRRDFTSLVEGLEKFHHQVYEKRIKHLMEIERFLGSFQNLSEMEAARGSIRGSSSQKQQQRRALNERIERIENQIAGLRAMPYFSSSRIDAVVEVVQNGSVTDEIARVKRRQANDRRFLHNLVVEVFATHIHANRMDHITARMSNLEEYNEQYQRLQVELCMAAASTSPAPAEPELEDEDFVFISRDDSSSEKAQRELQEESSFTTTSRYPNLEALSVRAVEPEQMESSLAPTSIYPQLPDRETLSIQQANFAQVEEQRRIFDAKISQNQREIIALRRELASLQQQPHLVIPATLGPKSLRVENRSADRYLTCSTGDMTRLQSGHFIMVIDLHDTGYIADDIHAHLSPETIAQTLLEDQVEYQSRIGRHRSSESDENYTTHIYSTPFHTFSFNRESGLTPDPRGRVRIWKHPLGQQIRGEMPLFMQIESMKPNTRFRVQFERGKVQYELKPPLGHFRIGSGSEVLRRSVEDLRQVSILYAKQLLLRLLTEGTNSFTINDIAHIKSFLESIALSSDRAHCLREDAAYMQFVHFMFRSVLPQLEEIITEAYGTMKVREEFSSLVPSSWESNFHRFSIMAELYTDIFDGWAKSLAQFLPVARTEPRMNEYREFFTASDNLLAQLQQILSHFPSDFRTTREAVSETSLSERITPWRMQSGTRSIDHSIATTAEAITEQLDQLIRYSIPVSALINDPKVFRILQDRVSSSRDELALNTLARPEQKMAVLVPLFKELLKGTPIHSPSVFKVMDLVRKNSSANAELMTGIDIYSIRKLHRGRDREAYPSLSLRAPPSAQIEEESLLPPARAVQAAAESVAVGSDQEDENQNSLTQIELPLLSAVVTPSSEDARAVSQVSPLLGHSALEFEKAMGRQSAS